uniref:EF-hand domain-containing protein n=1 Tax=Lotharella oceanica TaxID=641309 RepID=A0A7S2TFF4_9EUKA|mmetsp:Transcript_1147/g.2182  ORF Transcript_1147/g.2182 Transcript_1147/m.2182 type:complete len:199 (+) Transcript_1147:431-1027(+)
MKQEEFDTLKRVMELLEAWGIDKFTGSMNVDEFTKAKFESDPGTLVKVNLFSMVDLDEGGSLEAAELSYYAQGKAKFNDLDKDNGGTIDYMEFKDFLKPETYITPTGFAGADIDGGENFGALELEEFFPLYHYGIQFYDVAKGAPPSVVQNDTWSILVKKCDIRESCPFGSFDDGDGKMELHEFTNGLYAKYRKCASV